MTKIKEYKIYHTTQNDYPNEIAVFLNLVSVDKQETMINVKLSIKKSSDTDLALVDKINEAHKNKRTVSLVIED